MVKLNQPAHSRARARRQFTLTCERLKLSTAIEVLSWAFTTLLGQENRRFFFYFLGADGFRAEFVCPSFFVFVF